MPSPILRAIASGLAALGTFLFIGAAMNLLNIKGIAEIINDLSATYHSA
jgi:hypothetical protein|nr:MAG TPA: hypothetical protein [Caudoviricetes sp.]